LEAVFNNKKLLSAWFGRPCGKAWAMLSSDYWVCSFSRYWGFWFKSKLRDAESVLP